MASRVVCLSLAYVIVSGAVWCQDLSLPIVDDDHGLDSLIQLLEKKAMLEAQKPAGDRIGRRHRGVERPSPELGGRRPEPVEGQEEKPFDPIDLSRYLGTEGDQEEAIRRLKAAGKWPGDTGPGREELELDLFQKIPTNKRLDFAAECLKMGKYDEALSETTYVLATEPEEDHLARALALRLRALYRLRKYKDAQDACFRLRAYFPEGPHAAAALEFLERESGIDRLQEAVRQNQEDQAAHRKLMEAYRARNWLDLAIEFYTRRLPEKAVESYRHLCELHYLRQDWLGLIESSERGIELRTESPDLHYNMGVGYYHLDDAPAKLSSRESFRKAKELSKSAEFNKRVDWYLRRLPRAG